MARLVLASCVDGALLAGPVLSDVTGAREGAPSLPAGLGGDAAAVPSWGEIAARIRAEAPDDAQDARVRRRVWLRLLPLAAAVVWADVRLDGRTPGRALAGLRLERRDGAAPTAAQALVREGTPALRQLVADAVVRRAVPDDRLVAMLVRLAAALAGPPMVLLDPERRTLGDRLAGTRVVAARR